MSVVLADDGSGRALIFDRATGDVIRCSVPTAVENVSNGKGRFVHGDAGEALGNPAAPAAASVEPAPSLTLTQDDVLPLPAGEIGINETAIVADPIDDLSDVRTTPGDSAEKLEAIEREVDEANAAAKASPLDHDGDGKPGGSKPRKVWSEAEQAERAAVIATLKAANVKFFAGAPTTKLKALLPA